MTAVEALAEAAAIARFLNARPRGGAVSWANDELVPNVDPTTAIGIVLVAARARLRIARGEAITARELAHLAGCADNHVRLLIRRGAVRVQGRSRHIGAAEAARFLAARGIPGFGGPGQEPRGQARRRPKASSVA